MMRNLFNYLPILLLLSCGQAANDRIVFSSSRNGNSDIFLMDGHGMSLKQLTDSPAEEWAPVWMDAHTISFLRQTDEGITRHKLSLSSGTESQLQHPDNCILDDKNLLFDHSGEMGVYICDSDIFLHSHGEDQNLTLEFVGPSNYPSWVHGKQQLVFTASDHNNKDIMILDLETGKHEALTQEPSNDERGAISPDQTMLVYSSNRHDINDQDLYIKDLLTGEIQNITNSQGYELIGRWSHDGGRIYFGSDKDGNWELYSYDLETKLTTRLTFEDAFDGDPRIF